MDFHVKAGARRWGWKGVNIRGASPQIQRRTGSEAIGSSNFKVVKLVYMFL